MVALVRGLLMPVTTERAVRKGSKGMRGSFSLLGTFTCAALLAAPAGATATIYDLGTLGGTNSSGYAVNDAGGVAGDSQTGSAAYHAFRYDGTPGSGVMRDLSTLGGTASGGYDINTSGQVAGFSQITGDGASHAIRYDGTPGSGGIMRDLGSLGGDSFGWALNDAGQVAGESYLPGNTAVRAFRYDGTPGGGGVMRDLGTLGGQNSRGFGINNAGQVGGFSEIAPGAPFGDTAYHAFRYDGTPGSGGVMRDLGTLGGRESFGGSVNDAGRVTGYSYITGDEAFHAFRYDGSPGSGGVMRDLGTLGGANSFGVSLNDAGQVAGWSEIAGSSTQHAFLYSGTPGVDGRMIDLDAWLDADNPAEGAKWALNIAKLSDSGWITGSGIYDADGPGGVAGAERAFLLDASALVPEPGGLALLTASGALAARRRRRH
jgi:probable HAF family extracellular repeat protein